MRAAFIALTILFSSCVTTPKAPKEHCYCGPLLGSPNPSCGVWEKSKNLYDRPKVLWSFDGNCTQAACSKIAQQGCLKVEPWPHKTIVDTNKPATDGPCYCDQVVVSKEGQLETVCAAWVPGETDLLEYFSLERCSVETCQNEPFVLAKSHCQSGFVTFYQEEAPPPPQ